MVEIPFSEFDAENKCLLMRDGCEDIEWVRKDFGDPVAVSQDFVRRAFLHYRGVGVCNVLDKHVPAHLQGQHAEFLAQAQADYRDDIRRAENALVENGDVGAYDQAIAIAFCRYRGKRYGALEGAFATRFDPYY